MENFNNFENFDDIIEEDFPVKNHDSAVRRKNTYLKGKKRYDMVRQKDKLPPRKKDSVLRGMARKTCIFHVPKSWKIKQGYRINRGTVRRQHDADDKITEYAMEG